MGGRGSSSTSAKLSDRQRVAVDTYVADENGEVGLVRAVQNRKNIGSEQQKYKEMGEILEALIAQNGTENDIMFRGIKVKSFNGEGYKVGSIIDQKGTSSWSGTDRVALDYATRRDITGDSVMFVAYGSKNGAPIGRMSSLPEDEWLHSKRQKFEVTEISEMNYQGQKVTLVHVKEH